MRMQCMELSRNELDLVILGQLAALLSHGDTTKSHRPTTPRQRSSMAFHHGGVRICRRTFQNRYTLTTCTCTQLHNVRRYHTVYTSIGKDRFMASFLASGLMTRTHGNTKHKPKHSLKFDEIKNLVTFIQNHAEKHAILLPGRIPGYKSDKIQLLPSSTTKKVKNADMQIVHSRT